MIKFFRHIRRRLLAENRFTRYLIYAIGEIVLVVVGILLALQVNNWNEGRKRAVQERKVLKELLVNLRMDSLDHRSNLKHYARITRSSSYIVQELEARRAWDDTMAYHYSKLAEHGLATLNTSAYDNLRSVGFDLISNDSIRIALTSLHGITYNRFVQFERELAADNQSMVITPVFLKRIRMTGPWNRAEPIDLDRLYDDIEFIEMARWKATTMGFLAQLYEGAIISTSDLMRMIEQELDKKE